MSSDRRGRHEWLVVVVASIAFATSGPLAKVAVGVPPLAIAAGRTSLAAVILAAMGPRAFLTAVFGLGRRHALALLAAGVLLALHFGLFLAGLAATSLPAAVALVSLEPLSVVIVAWAVFGLRPTRGEAAGVGLATLGALVVASASGHGEHRAAGDVLVLGAVVLYGGYVAVARGLRDAMPVLPYAAGVYVVASLALLPLAFIDLARVPFPPSGSIAAVVALGLVPTLLGHTLLQGVARSAPPALVALVSPGETLGSLLIGAALLRAIPSAREAAGTACILAGSVVAILGGRGATR